MLDMLAIGFMKNSGLGNYFLNCFRTINMIVLWRIKNLSFDVFLSKVKSTSSQRIFLFNTLNLLIKMLFIFNTFQS